MTARTCARAARAIIEAGLDLLGWPPWSPSLSLWLDRLVILEEEAQ